MDKILERKSKFLSKLLRHDPQDLKMDDNGWVDTSAILKKLDITMFDLIDIVKSNDKQRFVFSEDNKKIRANQGHSIKVNVELKEVIPPDILYHGTATRFLDSIFEKGIIPGSRLHVHLSDNKELATKVGSRHGTPVILIVNAKEMLEDGLEFYLSENNVYLTNTIDKKYILTLT